MAYSLSDYAKCPPTCKGVGDAMIHWIIVLGGVWALMNFKNHTLVGFYDKLLFSNIEMGFGLSLFLGNQLFGIVLLIGLIECGGTWNENEIIS